MKKSKLFHNIWNSIKNWGKKLNKILISFIVLYYIIVVGMWSFIEPTNEILSPIFEKYLGVYWRLYLFYIFPIPITLIILIILKLKKEKSLEKELKKKIGHKIKFNPSKFVNPFLNRFEIDSDLITITDRKPKDETRRIYFEDFLSSLINNEFSRKVVLIIGQAGMGKTTFLKALEHRIFTSNNNKIAFFNEFNFFLTKNYSTPIELVNFFEQNYFSSETQKYDKNFEELLNEGKFIFMFDGLDEYFTSTKGKRGLIKYYLNLLLKFAQEYNSTVIITSRPTVWSKKTLILNIKIPEENIYELVKWDNKSIYDWIVKNKDEYENNKKYTSDEIFDKIQRIYNLRDLCKTPFLLKVCIEIYADFIAPKSYDEKINRIDIYDEIITKQIEFNIEKHFSGIFQTDSELLRKIIQYSALEYLLKGTQNLLLNNLDFLKAPFLTTNEKSIISSIMNKNNDEFISTFSNFGFVDITNNYSYIFTHQSFAEFLIAEVVFEEFKRCRVNKNEKRKLQYFSSQYFTPMVLDLLIEMLQDSNEITNITLNRNDFASFLSKPTNYIVIRNFVNLLLLFYNDVNEFRNDLIYLIKNGFNKQKELMLYGNGSSFVASNHLNGNFFQVFEEPEVIKAILGNEKLEILILINFSFQKIPTEIFELKKLKILTISYCNELKEIDHSIEKLKNLEAFNMR